MRYNNGEWRDYMNQIQNQVVERIPNWKQEYAGEFASGKTTDDLLKDLDDELQLAIVRIILKDETLSDLTLAENQAKEELDYPSRLVYLYNIQNQEHKMHRLK